MARGSLNRPIDGVEAVFADLDGVVYAGPDAIPGAIDALNRLAELMPLGYLTNNASRTDEQVAAHLRDLGLQTQARQVVTSPQAAVHLLAERVPPGATVLVVGGDGIRQELQRAGYQLVSSADEGPAAVVQGFSPHLGWSDLAEAAFALRGTDTVWIATNMDWTIPVARGIAPGNGTLVSAVHTAAGRMPDAVAGKPERGLFDLARQRFGVSRALMVGDRLDTDIAGANRAGLVSAQVLTGIDQAPQLLAASAEQRPRFILANLGGLFEPYPEPVHGRHGWQVGMARVRVDGAQVRIDREGDNALDLLRAACAAIWASERSIHSLSVPQLLLQTS